MTASTIVKNRILRRAGKILVLSAGFLLVIFCILIAGLTLYLTPSNLTRLLNREASEYFKADFHISNARFTIWSTFPHLFLEIDSLRIESRTLKNLPSELRKQLPSNADFLASTGKIKGSVNVVRLVEGGIWMKELIIDQLDINMVALNDSINNYNIIPSTSSKDFEVPYFTAGTVALTNPKPIRFFSAPTNTNAKMLISGVRLTRDRGTKDKYQINLGGKVDAIVREVEILSGFPFGLHGQIDLRFHPFRVGFKDFAINLGNTHGNLNMNLNLGENMKVNNLNYRIQAFDLTRFLRFLPGLDGQGIKGLNANLMVDAAARLTAPYSFSANELPSFEIDFNIPEGALSYTLSNGTTYSLRHSKAEGILDFNGKEIGKSRFTLKPLSIYADGIDLRIEGIVDSLLSHPLVSTSVGLDVDMSRLSQSPSLKGYHIAGQMFSKTDISFELPHLSSAEIVNLNVDGDVFIPSFALNCNKENLNIKGKKINLHYSGASENLSHQALSKSRIETILRAKGLNLTTGASSISTDGVVFKASSAINHFDSSSILQSIPYNAELSLRRIVSKSLTDSLITSINGLHLLADAKIKGAILEGSNLTSALSADKVSIDAPRAKFSSSGIMVGVKAKRLQNNGLAPHHPDFSTEFADSSTLNRIRHTATALSLQLPENVQAFLNSFDIALNLGVNRGSLDTPHFHQAAKFSGLKVSGTPDEVILKPVAIRAGSTAARISAHVSNLRNVFAFGERSQLPIEADIMLDTVNINYLARLYEETSPYKKGHSSTSDDSITMLIPRNLDAHIRASAKETIYTNLHLFDLETTINVKDGLASVPDLQISSDFGRASLGLSYDTRDASHLNFGLSAGVKDINVVTFFERFHTLLEMMPQMKNLSGYVSAQVKGEVDIYPNMDLNLPSLEANLGLQGRQLNVHQSHFIRRITRMMLIPEGGNLHIEDLNVKASIHDNLLELYPFNFEFSKYRIRMLGLNNFNGDLYYHVGIENNPLHLPFGINIEGNFSNPKLRFGSSDYKGQRSFDVTSNIMSATRINLVKEGKWFLKEFMHRAAISNEE